MKKLLLAFCFLFGLTACGNPAFQASNQSPVSDEFSQETTQYAEGYSLEQIGFEIAFPEQLQAYPFENHLPRMFAFSGVESVKLRSLLDEYPSLKADLINLNGGWTMVELHWNQLEGVLFKTPVMFFQAFKKSDIDGGMKVEYLSHTRNDLCVELSKEELMKYLWKETDEYYIVDFLDVYINDYRVFACEAALYHLDTAEYQDETPMYLDFNTFLGKINDVRNELKAEINLE